ncbi:MAG: fibronectin type III domain-containing protein [Actinomycetota bacterium]|nr:fibronectin type III domain-containing protein [Actinomycetota bacterium]
MKLRTARRHGGVPLLLVLVPLVLLPSVVASAGTDQAKTYLGPSYGVELLIPPTRYEHQSKLWFHDGAWWGLMFQPPGRTVRVFKLLPDHTWQPTRTVINADAVDAGDALPDGDVVHVVSRRADGALLFLRLSYDHRTQEYSLTTEPVVVTTRGSLAPASIAKDTTGRLWVTFATVTAVLVTYSDTDGSAWADLFIIAPTGAGRYREVSAVTAFDESIGILWSDQGAGAFRFAVHRDGAPAEEWIQETAYAGGRALADDQISIKAIEGDPSDTVVAAVKTSLDDQAAPPDAPLINVLARSPDGNWSSDTAATVANGNTSPVLQVDETGREIHLLTAVDGTVYSKRSPVDDISFAPGRGTAFVVGDDSDLNDPTGSKQPVNSRTGLVVLASGGDNRKYHHAELAIAPPPVDPNDTQPPTVPGQFWAEANGSGAVSLYWAPSNDGDRWAPGTDGVPVQGYIVYREGVEIGTTTQTSFGDIPPSGGRTYGYSVRAIDQAGNRSAPSTASVAVPEKKNSLLTNVLGWSMLGAAAMLATTVGLRRWKLTRDEVPDPREQDSTTWRPPSNV